MRNNGSASPTSRSRVVTKSRVSGAAARARGVPQVTPPRGQGLFDDGLEKLCCFDVAVAQGVKVFRHAAVGDTVETVGVEPGLPQIFL